MAAGAKDKRGKVDWRVAFRRSLRRSAQIVGAGILILTLIFLALSMASYTQTDPSRSTAASSDAVENWMGESGAWAADLILGIFGITSILILPLLYIGTQTLAKCRK